MGKFGMIRKAVNAARNTSDEKIDKGAQKIRGKAPESTHSKLDKGADWAKKHNKD
ncbi:hypothetical protein ACNI3K_11360 [Demequina sp. SO4-13]|uniref:hypothetical protein n=1 Tax=Demequina sp. SO4-13 TaxID=3401027 RepID=UPI003AF45612